MSETPTPKKRKKFSGKRSFLLGLLLMVVALSFVNAPEPLNPATEPLPTAYEAYHRGEEQTYLTFPEWYIVYSSDEYAHFIKDNPPSAFPYFGSIGQFWNGYWKIYQLTKDKYEFNIGYHVMVGVIGTSLTIEYIIKGVYENTIGRLTEWLSAHGTTDEDSYAAKVAMDYVNFIHVYPWYEFNFAAALRGLWVQTDLQGHNVTRQIERKLILSVEYGGKAAYGWVMKKLTYLSYEPASSFTIVEAANVTQATLEKETAIRFLKKSESGDTLLAIPRYDAFKNYMLLLAKQNVQFKEIAGNTSDILVTALMRKDSNYNLSGEVAFTQDILTVPERKRIAIKVPVASLVDVLLALDNQGIEIEHVYDY